MRKAQAKVGFLGTLRELLFLLLIVFIVRTWGFGLYQVPTGSMETTMLVGERFFADKFTMLFSPPQRGKIISFNDPLFAYSQNTLVCLFQKYVWGPSNWTKRVIGIPGDTVRGVIQDGRPVVYVNDTKLDEPYVNKYPLIALWKENPKRLQENIEREAYYLVQQGRLNPTETHNYMNSCLVRSWDWQPYDAQYAFANQPYYRINEQFIVKFPEGQQINESGYAVKNGMLMKEPGTPRPLEDGSFGAMKNGANHWNGTDEFYVELKEHEYWLMGDNRRGSLDSRVFGPVHDKLIHGKIIFRIWSNDSAESWWILDLIKHPIDFWKRMRWCRFFNILR